MRQAVPKKIKNTKKQSKSGTKKKSGNKGKRQHPQYGTSKLEVKFKEEFLDKLGVEYIYQFEAKDIGRFFDFYLPNQNLIIEVDGQYHHADPLIYKPEDLNPMQKRNKRVDALKDKWCLLHGIPIMRIWENDINKNPTEVMKRLEERIVVENNEMLLKEERKKRQDTKSKKNNENDKVK